MVNKNASFPFETVIYLYQLFNTYHIKIWLDGGWGVDALLEEQTRLHGDLDIVVEERNVKKLMTLLQSVDYFKINRSDTSDWNFVLGHKDGLEIDVHVISFDEHGNGIYGPKERGIFYPAYAFQGVGKLNSIQLNCLSAEYQLESHTGYPLREKDFHDVIALCEKFNLKRPAPYRLWKF